MKGIFIHDQFEFRIEIKGDDFCQGDSLPCTFTLKNHATTSRLAPELSLELVAAELKHIKEKKYDQFELVVRAQCASLGEIAPQEQKSFIWSFVLDKNCLISDKNQSLSFLFGSVGERSSVQIIPITIKPHRYIQKIASIFDSPFQFVIKGEKSSKGWVEFKMKPPNSRRLSLVNELLMGFQFEGDDINLRYTFKVNEFETGENSLNVKKGKSVVEQRLAPSSYLLTPEHINHQAIEAKIEEALVPVATRL